MSSPAFVIGQKVLVSSLGTTETNTGRIIKVFSRRLRIYIRSARGDMFEYDTSDEGKTWVEQDSIGSPVTITAV